MLCAWWDPLIYDRKDPEAPIITAVLINFILYRIYKIYLLAHKKYFADQFTYFFFYIFDMDSNKENRVVLRSNNIQFPSGLGSKFSRVFVWIWIIRIKIQIQLIYVRDPDASPTIR